MRRPIIIFIVLSVISFLILSIVQYKLVRNTYQLQNDRYYYSEKSLINEKYYQLIRNDKLFPGGQKIIDSILVGRMRYMDSLHRTDKKAFDIYRQEISDSIFQALREKESIRSFLTDLKNDAKLEDSLQYALIITSLDVMLEENTYVPVYNHKQRYPLIDSSIQEERGVRIGGELKNLTAQNLVTGLTISSPSRYSYRINFGLYVEPLSRSTELFWKMAKTYSLSMFSFLIVVSLFFITFRNWQRQKKLSEMKSDFINNITHEFHTPLSAIIVANKSLQNEKITEKKENIRPLSDIIQRQAERLNTLISQVLDIVSMDKIKLRKKEHSVHLLLEEILLDYRLQSAENFRITFNKEAKKDVVPLDSFYFTTILQNILDNSIKYNTNKEKEITVSTQSDEQEMQIIIKDNGIGMNTETIRHIFDKFYRHTNNLLNQTKGLGLGLYYVRQSISAHNWKIQVESKPGSGSRFNIHIPFQNKKA